MDLSQWAEYTVRTVELILGGVTGGASRKVGTELVTFLQSKLSQKFRSKEAIQEKLSTDPAFAQQLGELFAKLHALPDCPPELKYGVSNPQINSGNARTQNNIGVATVNNTENNNYFR
ncbi:MAG: hypothetical protein ACLFV6_01675 [Spirulinaceae cyanobacterium]